MRCCQTSLQIVRNFHTKSNTKMGNLQAIRASQTEDTLYVCYVYTVYMVRQTEELHSNELNWTELDHKRVACLDHLVALSLADTCSHFNLCCISCCISVGWKETDRWTGRQTDGETESERERYDKHLLSLDSGWHKILISMGSLLVQLTNHTRQPASQRLHTQWEVLHSGAKLQETLV